MSKNSEANEQDKKRPIQTPAIIRGIIKSNQKIKSTNWFGKLNTKIQTEIRHEHNEDAQTD